MFKQLLQADAINVRPGRLLPHGRRQRGAVGDPDGRASSECRSARTRAASACANTSSTSRSSTTSRSPAPSRTASASTSTTCTSTSSIPCDREERALRDPLAPGYSIDDEAAVARRVRVPERRVWQRCARRLSATASRRRAESATSAGSSAPCSSSPPPSTTSTARSSRILKRTLQSRSSAGGRAGLRRHRLQPSSSPTRSGSC